VIFETLGNAVTPDPMISGNWIIGVIGAAGTLLGIIFGFLKGKSQEVVIKDQPVRFTKDQRPVSYDQHHALDARVGRIEQHLDAIQRDQGLQYKQILEAGAERELRMTEFFGAGLREVHARLDKILEVKSNPTRRS
jgi:ABC-type thiamine transport system ATPase subunit